MNNLYEGRINKLQPGFDSTWLQKILLVDTRNSSSGKNLKLLFPIDFSSSFENMVNYEQNELLYWTTVSSLSNHGSLWRFITLRRNSLWSVFHQEEQLISCLGRQKKTTTNSNNKTKKLQKHRWINRNEIRSVGYKSKHGRLYFLM